MRVIRPHNMWSLFKTASGPVDTTNGYDIAWLTDGATGRPVRGTSGGGAYGIAGTAANVDTVVLVNTNVASPATVSVDNGFGSMTIPAARPGAIPRNPFIRLLTPVSVSNLTVTIASNPSTLMLGEILVGLSEPWDLLSDNNEFSMGDFGYRHDDEVSMTSVPPYDLGTMQRTLTGSAFATMTDLQFVQDWFTGTRFGTWPSIIIPNEQDNDAWAVYFSDRVTWQQIRGYPDYLFQMNVSLTEYKQTRWS